ncbi:MAG TPA: BREX system P-loop protein BrxC [Anaerolineaceae bacterium]|nr:BREX system P-loop protein BrxC [Anaerolineaceae bacterium]HPN52274.1 BREX system P-loop protein BrxC [Anaerolineaceae bacterium]
MILNQIFQKPVNRTIEGVIKADDESGLKNEVEEYVLTNEVSKRLESFLEAYTNYQGANGAWISGFFGSGKSHLLKILALLLENRTIDGSSMLTLFLPKCGNNAILRAVLQKAAAIPSKSILFNIDQKADIISKTQMDALLAVFVKVFDEMCGYYGKQGYIASFERDLDKRGLYQTFRQAFERIAGVNWETGREQALLEADNIALAYAQITGAPADSASGILDKYRADYKVSIEDFALQVNDYIERQGSNFRLNFFVDEVGQYIANNIKLMTNLQTIAESLATKSRGRAWIIVTAQEEIGSVIGTMNTQQANDFSKIQARFATRLKLTSQNVSEVIQKRLLLKNEQGTTLLMDVYHQQVNNFGTLFDFTDGSTTYGRFHDQAHFVNSYPFIPYQFDLFQASIQNLSDHNAFEGRHSSVGERSMLAVFQHVAIHIIGNEVGQLATFDLMFEGIRNALKSQFQQAILVAERNLNDPFAVRVLKALFLVKYVKGFKATLHNVSILMIDRFGCDMLRLRKQVEGALNLLEQQTYIQRNGDVYEYLTNEEKDVEEEIKNTDVDSDAVLSELSNVVFEQIIKERKITCEDNKQDFPFSRRLDDQLAGREYELTVRLVSPFHEYFDQIETLQMHSMGRDELLVVLPPDDRLVQDLLMYKRTDKYIQQKNSVTQQDSIKHILTEKSFKNRERAQQIVTRLKNLLARARMFVGGTEIDVPGMEPTTRVIKGFQELIRRTYPNLKMLHGINYSENDIDQYLRKNTGTLYENQPGDLSEAEQEILAYVQANKSSGMRTTIKTLVERFERKPYGWSLAAVLCNLALLSVHGKVEMRGEGNLLEDAALARALKNTQAHANVVLDPQIEFSAAQVSGLKRFFEDFFDKLPQFTEARELGKETAQAFNDRLDMLTKLLANQALYPFLSELSNPVSQLKELVGKPYTYYLTDLPRQANELLDSKDNTIDPIVNFWNGVHKQSFDAARQFQQQQSANFDYLDGDEAQKFMDLLADRTVFRGNKMQQARQLMDALQGKLAEKLKAEKKQAADAILAQQARLTSMPEYGGLSTAQQGELAAAFTSAIAQMDSETLIARIRDRRRTFEEREYQQLLAKMTRWSQPPVEYPGGGGTDVHEPRVEYVPGRSIPVDFDRAWLANEEDINRYLAALRAAWLKEIHNGKRINI